MKKYLGVIFLLLFISLFLFKGNFFDFAVIGQSIGQKQPISLVKEIKKSYSLKEELKIEVNNESQSQLKIKLIDVNNNEVPIEIIESNNEGVNEIKFNPPPQFKSGRYKLTVTDEVGNQIERDFLWGVLAINPNKSVYYPGEKAELAMAVLDEGGKMDCSAKLILKVTGPEGERFDELSTENGKIIVNSECQVYGFTLKPDYQAELLLEKNGKYDLELLAETKNGFYSITDAIEVAETIKYEIERKSATRIYPINSYPMKIRVKFLEDFEGNIYESVPESFDISQGKEEGIEKYISIDTFNKSKKIKWQVKLKAGEEVTLAYEYKAPLDSPQFYLTGPLELSTLTDLLFVEARSWQIASDAPGETRTKTVKFFIGQNGSLAGVGAGVTWPANFSVYLPDIISSATAIKSAYIDYSFQNATTTAAGKVTLRLKLSSEGTYTTAVSATYTGSGENFTQRFRANFTDKLKADIQSSGTYSYNFSGAISGTSQKAANATITITYDYDSLAQTQINTARFFGGQNGSNIAVGSSTTFTLAQPSLPEDSASIYSAWAEITANTVSTSTTDETIQIRYDTDSATSYYLDNAGGAGSQIVYLLHPKNITDASHTLSVKPTAGYPLTLISYEQYITYSFNYSASSSILTTQELMIMANGARGSTSTLTAFKTFNIPESSISWKSIYIAASVGSIADTSHGITAKIGSTDSVFNNAYAYDWNGESSGNYRILSNETNDLNTMSTGNNDIYLAWKINSGAANSRFASVILTYAHAKSDPTVNASANFLVANGRVYGTGYTAPFDVSVSGSSQNVQSYLKGYFRTGATTATGTISINVLPSSTTSYLYSSSGEHQIVSIGHILSSEVGATGSYVATLNDSLTSVKDADITLNFQYYNLPSDIPILVFPENNTKGVSQTPTFRTVATDINGNNLQYEIKICTDLGMSANCLTFDQSVSNLGWSGQDVGTSAFASGTTAVYILQVGNSLALNTNYYWKTRVKDYDGTNTWSPTQISAFTFRTLTGFMAPVINQIMRHGQWFLSGVRQKFTF